MSESKELNAGVGASSALAFFSTDKASEAELRALEQCGVQQLQDTKSALEQLSRAQESAQCQEFFEWASNSTGMHAPQRGRKGKAKVQPNVKFVRYRVPDAALDVPPGRVVSVADFAPKTGVDDMVYAGNRDVWENLPRGCAMLVCCTEAEEKECQSNSNSNNNNNSNADKDKLNGFPTSASCIWGVRSNRKFTGHEDESSTDAALYSVDNGSPATHALVTLKENGQVLHIAARWCCFDDSKQDALVVLLGSKKVHVAVQWDGPNTSREQFEKRLNSYPQLERFTLVKDMGSRAFDLINHDMLVFLADHRLVINTEFIKPTGSGPIDNATVHKLERPTPVAFSLVFNAWELPEPVQLCLHPVYALSLLSKWGFRTVRYKLLPLDRLAACRKAVATLPGIEGSVVYHMNRTGVVRLEKTKSVQYVVVRALREKAKGFIRVRTKPGLFSEWTATVHCAQNAEVKPTQDPKHGSVGLVHIQCVAEELADLLGASAQSPFAATSSADSGTNEPPEDDEKYAGMSKTQRKRARQRAKKKAQKQRKHQLTSAGQGQDVGQSTDPSLLPTPYYITFSSNDTAAECAKLTALLRQQIIPVYLQRRRERLRQYYLTSVLKRVRQRIAAIDHVPMEDQEREAWQAMGAAFMKWLFRGVLEDTQRFVPSTLFDNFSARWTEFSKQYNAQGSADTNAPSSSSSSSS